MKFKNATVLLISLLYILLMVYAALSKLLEFEAFNRQLSMSPVLSSHAFWLVWCVPLLEIAIAVFLSFSRTRLHGLIAAFSLMVAFTVYIYLIMNHASHVPCSCGGILDDLGWKEHFWFNLAFVALALCAIVLEWQAVRNTNNLSLKRILAGVASTAIFSAGFTVALFLLSERIVHHHNRFERRFPHPSVTEIAKANLHFDSYYIAGIDNGKIYLGNSTARVHLLAYDLNLKQRQVHTITLDTNSVEFVSTQLRIDSGQFYLYDGTVPFVFQGSTNDWKAKRLPLMLNRFTLAEPFSGNLAVRNFAPEALENVLGVQPLNAKGRALYNTKLLEKQIDGLFDTDGTMLTYGQRMVYLYHYRNQFVVAGPSLSLIARGSTIDTISQAQLHISRESNTGFKQMAKVPLLVNKTAALYKNLLFVNSQLPGKGDSNKLWKQASIIDVYDVRDGSYRFSFPLYDIEGRKLKSFRVHENKIYLIINNWLVRYDLRDRLLDSYEGIPGRVQGSDRKPVKE